MIGVRAFMIPASIEETRSCANANNTPGITFKSNPTIQRCASSFKLKVGLNLFSNTSIQRVAAPKKQRKKVTPTGVRKVSAFSIKRKEAPQTIPREI
jgi:hypothetical protein